MIGRLPVTTVAALAIALTACLPARADAVADFYKGKQISLIIGTSSGNDYDFRARLLARHMGRFIPGESDARSAQHAGRRRHQRRQLARQRRAA